jgi:glutathione peroxidase
MTNVYDFSATSLTGKDTKLSDFRGKVLLIVNTASKCGFTPQYEGLERLHKELEPKGFSVLGFPCNQFGRQEPGNASEIGQFCSVNYGVTFPMFAKIDVNGEDAHPLFAFLKQARRGIFGTARIKWNFTKFLVDRKGEVVARFAPATKPEAVSGKIAALL